MPGDSLPAVAVVSFMGTPIPPELVYSDFTISSNQSKASHQIAPTLSERADKPGPITESPSYSTGLNFAEFVKHPQKPEISELATFSLHHRGQSISGPGQMLVDIREFASFGPEIHCKTDRHDRQESTELIDKPGGLTCVAG